MIPLAEVRKEITEDSGNSWIYSLRKMIIGSNDNERYGGVQALSIFAQYGK